MPDAPRQFCISPGCKAIASTGSYCTACRHVMQTDDRARRGSASKRGYGVNWRKLRRIVLRESPICSVEGCGQPASLVDHIVPRSQGGGDLFENLQSLCTRHHNQKTSCERDGRPVKFTNEPKRVDPRSCSRIGELPGLLEPRGEGGQSAF